MRRYTSLTISETSDKYVAVITTDPVIEPTEEAENSLKLTADQNETIKFYNKPRGVKVVLKKAGYRNTDAVPDLEPLTGATFKIHQGSTTGQLITTEEDGITKSSFTSEGGEAIFFEGMLESRKSYYLEETTVPDGYMAPTGMYYFNINDDGVVLHCTETTGQASYADWISEETDDNGETVYVITIRNVAGIELPASGGSGTRLIYLFGTILMAFAATGLVMWKKRRA